VHIRPTTREGRLALRLAIASVVLLLAAPLVNAIPVVRIVAIPTLYTAAFACAIGGGIIDLTAIFRRGAPSDTNASPAPALGARRP
jgi:hypothetical protein